jgi:type II secretory pathway component PulF
MKRVHRNPVKELQRRQANRAHASFKRRQTRQENLAAQQAATLLAPGRLLNALSKINAEKNNERPKYTSQKTHS